MGKHIASWTRLAAALALSAWGVPALADKALNMPEGVTELSVKIYGLHMEIFWWCVGIAVVVFGVMIYSIARFRKSAGAVADKSLVHSTRVEIIWTLVPIAILVIMAVPAARTLIEIEDTRGSEISIKVTGYQWRWHYDYLDRGVSYFSTLSRDSNAARQLGSGVDPNTVPNYLLDVDHPLVIPAGTKVRLLLTAGDVIHAWWVPDFGMKKDAIPGFVNELWVNVDPHKTGVYRGQCAEYCGTQHALMAFDVIALPRAEFDTWLAALAQPARQPQHPVIGARRKAELVAGVAEQRQPGRVRLGHLFDDGGWAMRVGQRRRQAKRRVALALEVAGPRHAFRHDGARFGSCRAHQVGGRDGGNVDADVYPVEHRARDARLIIGGATRAAQISSNAPNARGSRSARASVLPTDATPPVPAFAPRCPA